MKNTNESPRPIETEVLPPKAAEFENDERFIKMVARLMDTAFVIPGTNIRFGLDPIIGLLPGVGDTADALVSTFLLSRAARYGVPKIVLARMALNVVINALVGAMPVVGDAFSVWFKSNVLNYELLRKHATSRLATTTDWVFVVGLIGVAVLSIVFAAAAVIFAIAKLAEAVD